MTKSRQRCSLGKIDQRAGGSASQRQVLRAARIKLLTERLVQPRNSHKFRQTIARYEVVARVNWMWDCIILEVIICIAHFGY